MSHSAGELTVKVVDSADGVMIVESASPLVAFFGEKAQSKFDNKEVCSEGGDKDILI